MNGLVRKRELSVELSILNHRMIRFDRQLYSRTNSKEWWDFYISNNMVHLEVSGERRWKT